MPALDAPSPPSAIHDRSPLSASLSSGRGEELAVERLVVLDPSGRVRRFESQGRRNPLARSNFSPADLNLVR